MKPVVGPKEVEQILTSLARLERRVQRLERAASAYMTLGEISDPGNGSSDTARIYARDNGAGKTQLVAVFSSGAVQVLATQP